MNQKKSANKAWNRNKLYVTIITALLILALGIIGLLIGINKYRYYNDAANSASTATVRDLILLAVRGVKKDAPVDFKTGDVYFPEAKLYLPRPDIALPLTYSYDKGNGREFAEELTISTYPVRGTEKLYIAKNQDELLTAVPKLQSCSRGIKITHEISKESLKESELLYEYKLANGKDAFVYLEKLCPELKPIAKSFTRLQSY